MSDHDSEPKTPPQPAKPAEPAKPVPPANPPPPVNPPPRPTPPTSPSPSSPPPASRTPSSPRAPRRGITAVLALLLALIALAAVAFGGWRVWLLQRGDRAGSQTLTHLQQRLDSLEATQGQQRQDQASVRKQLSAEDKANNGLDQRIDGLSERARNLETAVANLSASKLSAHNSMALDETAMLLRMAGERYKLFQDGAGALKAYALAAQTLATVDDPAFSGVRQSIDSERATLAATHPTTLNADLVALAQLRSELPSLPPRPLDTPTTRAPQGFWQRTWHVLSHVVSVTRDNGAPVNLADARLARELTAIDVAQAQAALLAHDRHAMHAALARVDTALDKDFDKNATSVQQARAKVKQLQSSQTAASAKLGSALQELQNLRRVRDAADTPAPATSAARAAPATAASTPATPTDNGAPADGTTP